MEELDDGAGRAGKNRGILRRLTSRTSETPLILSGLVIGLGPHHRGWLIEPRPVPEDFGNLVTAESPAQPFLVPPVVHHCRPAEESVHRGGMAVAPERQGLQQGETGLAGAWVG